MGKSIFLNSNVEKCLQQNQMRPIDEQVPRVGILSKKKDLVYPRKDEGFDSLFLVKIDSNGSFVVEDWKDEV